MMLNGYERIFILVKRMKNEQILKTDWASSHGHCV